MLRNSARYDRCDDTVDTIHARDELVELVCERVAILSVAAESTQYLVFVHLIEFLPVLHLVKAFEKLSLAWIAQDW